MRFEVSGKDARVFTGRTGVYRQTLASFLMADSLLPIPAPVYPLDLKKRRYAVIGEG
jgi:hypothetical protein